MWTKKKGRDKKDAGERGRTELDGRCEARGGEEGAQLTVQARLKSSAFIDDGVWRNGKN